VVECEKYGSDEGTRKKRMRVVLKEVDILRVKELRSVETSVAIYQPTRRNITEDLNLLELCHP
jgi:hypothetical protein